MPRYCKPKRLSLGGTEIVIYDEKTREGARTGEHLIIRNAEGHAVRVKVSDGPAGMSVMLSRVIGGLPITVTGNLTAAQGSEIIPQVDASEVSLCVYRQDERSLAFKAWYADPDNNQYPERIPA